MFNLTQIGYLGTAGPIFTAPGPGGKLYIFIYDTQGGVTGLRIKEQQYASNLGLNASDYTLGSYTANQRFDDVPSFKQPTGGTNFSGYDNNVTAMVTATTVPITTPAPSTNTGGSTTSSTGVTTKTDTTVYSAPTLMEQVTTFVSAYWWLVAIIVVFLLWKPVLGPALGFSKKKRR